MNDANAIPLTAVRDVPVYPDVPTYYNLGGQLHIWEGDDWKEASLAWKEGCYIGSNLSGIPEVTFSGPNAQELLSRLSINNVYDWPIGTSKHIVMTDENGFIANHALTIRDAEDRFRQFAFMSPWWAYKGPELGIEAEITMRDIFLFQVAGPKSLQVLERVIGEEQRDVAFLGMKKVAIPGIDAEVELELSRIGMAGTLAYEVRGPLEHGPAVFDAIFQAGQEFGIKRLGWRTYVVNHTEAGFPQQGCSFTPAPFVDPEYMAHPFFGSIVPPLGKNGILPGSAGPTDFRARLRTPQEVNWGWMAKFDHDFIGREAVEAAAANPVRKTVTLVWNKEDILDVFASQFEPGQEYKNFEWPTTPQGPAMAHADLVTVGDKTVGISSLAVYSYYYRKMISHATIDLDKSEIGTEVVIQWGDHGGRIKQIRATVERFPYLDLPTNKATDLSSIPSGVAAKG